MHTKTDCYHLKPFLWMSQNKYENSLLLHEPPPLFKHRLDLLYRLKTGEGTRWQKYLATETSQTSLEEAAGGIWACAASQTDHTHTHSHTDLHHPHKVTQFTHNLRGRKHNCSEETQRFTSSRKQDEGWCNRSLQRKTAACHEFIQMRAFVKAADDSH